MSSLTVFGNSYSPWKRFHKLLPNIFDHSNFILLLIVFHSNYTLYFVADSKIFDFIFLYLYHFFLTLPDVLTLGYFQAIKPSFSIDTFFFDVLAWMILNNVYLIFWNFLFNIDNNICVVSV